MTDPKPIKEHRQDPAFQRLATQYAEAQTAADLLYQRLQTEFPLPADQRYQLNGVPGKYVLTFGYLPTSLDLSEIDDTA